MTDQTQKHEEEHIDQNANAFRINPPGGEASDRDGRQRASTNSSIDGTNALKTGDADDKEERDKETDFLLESAAQFAQYLQELRNDFNEYNSNFLTFQRNNDERLERMKERRLKLEDSFKNIDDPETKKQIAIAVCVSRRFEKSIEQDAINAKEQKEYLEKELQKLEEKQAKGEPITGKEWDHYNDLKTELDEARQDLKDKELRANRLEFIAKMVEEKSQNKTLLDEKGQLSKDAQDELRKLTQGDRALEAYARATIIREASTILPQNADKIDIEKLNNNIFKSYNIDTQLLDAEAAIYSASKSHITVTGTDNKVHFVYQDQQDGSLYTLRYDTDIKTGEITPVQIPLSENEISQVTQQSQKIFGNADNNTDIQAMERSIAELENKKGYCRPSTYSETKYIVEHDNEEYKAALDQYDEAVDNLGKIDENAPDEVKNAALNQCDNLQKNMNDILDRETTKILESRTQNMTADNTLDVTKQFNTLASQSWTPMMDLDAMNNGTTSSYTQKGYLNTSNIA